MYLLRKLEPSALHGGQELSLLRRLLLGDMPGLRGMRPMLRTGSKRTEGLLLLRRNLYRAAR